MPGFIGILLVFLVGGVIFVNGFTDAPNAITGIVSTNTLTYKKAVVLAAIFNLLGIAVMSFFRPSVTNTMISLADFSGVPRGSALAALCAVMLSIIIFAVVAWYFGIPTSESHALAAALAGAGYAVHSSNQSNGKALVIYGLFISLFIGFLLGFIIYRILNPLLSRFGEKQLKAMQIIGASSMAFMHGAQDGQKFIAVFIMSELINRGISGDNNFSVLQHIPAVILCAVLMFVGTLMGGKRIIENIGSNMVSMNKKQAVCSDIGGAICLLMATFGGVPMSTTHTNTSAIAGAVFSGDKNIDFKTLLEMLFAWLITFPACAAIAYILTKIICLFI